MVELISSKRGWLRIVEAVIAITLIGSVLIIINQSVREREEVSYNNLMRQILDEVARNVEYRKGILSANEGIDEKIKEEVVGKRITQPNLRTELVICEVDDTCAIIEESNLESMAESPIGVFSEERIISSGSTTDSRKIKLYLWYSRQN